MDNTINRNAEYLQELRLTQGLAFSQMLALRHLASEDQDFWALKNAAELLNGRLDQAISDLAELWETLDNESMPDI